MALVFFVVDFLLLYFICLADDCCIIAKIH